MLLRERKPKEGYQRQFYPRYMQYSDITVNLVHNG